MNQEYFGIFSDMMLDTYYDVLIWDIKLKNVYFLKLGRKPELEETFVDDKEAFNYLEENGITQMAERFLIGSFKETIMERAYSHKSGFLFVNRTTIQGEKRWVTVSMFVPKAFGTLDSKLIFCTTVLDEETALKHEIMMGVEQNVFKIGKIYLQQNRTQSIQLSYNENVSLKFYKGKTYRDEVEFVANNMIHPDDRNIYLDYMDAEKIERYHLNGYRDYGFMCRRKSRNYYDWVYIRIIPTIDYKQDDMVFGFQIIAINEPIVKYVNTIIMDENRYGEVAWRSEFEFKRYVERIRNALGAFTYHFETFIEVDLRSNRYISFKGSGDGKSTLFAQEGHYPTTAEVVISKLYADDEAEKLRGFINLDNVRQRLTDSSTITDNFRRKTGELVKLTFSKTESIRGVPSTANATSQIINENENLLKVVTFGNFEVLDAEGKPIFFEKKQSKQVLAYIIDKNGYPITNDDIITDVLEKSVTDLNARKYASALIRKAMRDLENAGYPNVIIKESNQTRINRTAVDCDYYHLLDGNIYYWTKYQNEYMKEYSWAEETNSEIAHFFDK